MKYTKLISIAAIAGMWGFILLGVAATAANDKRANDKRTRVYRGEVVMVGSPLAYGQQITVGDLTNDDGSIAEGAFDTFWGDQADIVKFALPPTLLPRSSCDDAEDCAKTIKDTCKLVDPLGQSSGITVSYNGQEGTCSGRCDDGRAVSVVCVGP